MWLEMRVFEPGIIWQSGSYEEQANVFKNRSFSLWVTNNYSIDVKWPVLEQIQLKNMTVFVKWPNTEGFVSDKVPFLNA